MKKKYNNVQKMTYADTKVYRLSRRAFAHLERLEVEVAEVEEIGGESEVASSSGAAN